MKKNVDKALLLFTALFLCCLLIPGELYGQVEPISLKEALERAEAEDKKVLVDVYASWCPYCRRMHSNVYPSRQVQEALSEYYLWVKIDIESESEVEYHGKKMTEAEFARALANRNVPTTYFLNQSGEIIGAQPGFIEADTFSRLLHFVGSDAYLNQSFQDYEGPG